MAQINDIGIDLGTSNTIIYMKGQGIKLREPSMVAVNRDTGMPIAYGNDAFRMVGRTPANIQIIRPFAHGEMGDFEVTGAMIRYMVSAVIGKHFLARPRAIISVPTGIKDVEKKALISVMFDAGMRRTQLVEKNIAAALGAGLSIENSFGHMVIDMSAGATDISVLCNGNIALASSVRIGGDQFDDSVIRYVRKKYNLLIGEKTAEQVKITLGSAVLRESEVYMDVTGRNLISGLPKTMALSSTEIYEALKDNVNDLIEAIQIVIEKTPPQLASDIFDVGITMTGGAACLYGLSDAIQDALKIETHVASDARDCVVLGCARILEDPNGMKHFLG